MCFVMVLLFSYIKSITKQGMHYISVCVELGPLMKRHTKLYTLLIHAAICLKSLS